MIVLNCSKTMKFVVLGVDKVETQMKDVNFGLKWHLIDIKMI
jgi:hypothetical protein